MAIIIIIIIVIIIIIIEQNVQHNSYILYSHTVQS